jgi:hypothetical protein
MVSTYLFNTNFRIGLLISNHTETQQQAIIACSLPYFYLNEWIIYPY